MKVSFENLGIVKKADIDLSKKLLVFCGPNGTGKTYVSYAVYGYLSRNILMSSNHIFNTVELVQRKEMTIDLDYNKLYIQREHYDANPFIHQTFGLIGNWFFENFKIKSILSKDEFVKKIRGATFEFEHTVSNCTIVYEKESESDKVKLTLKNDFEIDITNIWFDVDVLQNMKLVKYLCFESIIDAYILPVERSSVYTFADELAKNKFSDPESKGRYPRPIQDALATAIDLNVTKTRKSKYKWLAEEIEQQILHGQINVSIDGEMQFRPDNSDKILSVHLSASIIKNLSGLLIYLKHQAKENELLIIDEPELGLHPDNQILLARIFARLINNGIRLLISTHSDYIIRELNNLIMLSSENIAIKENIEKWGYKKEEKINVKDVGAYLFDFDTENPDQIVVKSLEVDDKGFEVETIDKAINLLNENSENIYYNLKYGKKG